VLIGYISHDLVSVFYCILLLPPAHMEHLYWAFSFESLFFCLFDHGAKVVHSNDVTSNNYARIFDYISSREDTFWMSCRYTQGQSGMVHNSCLDFGFSFILCTCARIKLEC